MKIYLKVFLILILIVGSTTISYSQCSEIKAESTVKKTSTVGNDGEITIEFKQQNSDEFTLNLFGPNKKNKLKTNETQFKGLSKGKYLIVIVGKDDKKDYCPKSLEVTIN